jgi:glycosyltransferase involved in cell wall biosynthesis
MIKKIFSIVIPTLNEEKYLPRLLEDLEKQSFPKELFEVVHVDGNSEDKTVEEATKFNKKINIKSIVVKKRNVAFQRNTGADNATGKWIIFMDADNELPDYFLDGIKYQLAKNKKTDVFSCWINPDGDSPKDVSVAKTANIGMEIYKSLGKPAVFGALIGVKQNVHKEIGFDEKHKVAEDGYYVVEAIKKGFHYQLFKQPTYTYSLRRLRKEGSLKMVRIVSTLGLKFIQGKDFADTDYGYVMKGGKYYEEDTSSFFKDTFGFLKKSSKNQILQFREILKTINEELGV